MRQSQVRIFCSVYFLGSLKSGRDPIWACYSAQPGWLLCILVLQIRQESLQTEEFSALCVLALGEVSALMTVWSGWRHRKWIVFPGLFQRSMQGNPWLSLQLLPGVEEYVQCLHSSASSFTSPDLQHWKLEKKSIFRKLGLNRPQEMSIYLRQPGQGKWRRCPDQEKVGDVRWVENFLSCCFFLRSWLRQQIAQLLQELD